MMDMEKVIKGLEHCANGICNECPYIYDCWTTECNPAARDALALLKAQEAVVMAGAELTDAELIEKIRKAPIVLKPNVDAVPVVRCRDCKHRPTDNRGRDDDLTGFAIEFPDSRCPCQCEDGWYNWYPADDWFCGNGERRDES